MFCNWCDTYIPDIQKGKKAGVFSRFFATLIDPFIILIFYFIVAIVGGSIGAVGGAEAAIGALFISFFIAIIAYLIFSIWFLNKGMTPGKWLLGLQVVEMHSGANPGILRMFIREFIGKFVSSLFLGIGYFWAIWDKDGQTWHDKIAGTVVVRRP